MRFLIFNLTLISLSIFFTSCATSFTGSPHVNKAYCQKYCAENGLSFSGMVALGEYSSGCICTQSKTSSLDNLTQNSVSGAGAAAVGVITQMRQQQATAAVGSSH